MEKKIREIIQKKEVLGELPAHASTWQINQYNKISSPGISTRLNSIVKPDLLSKPVSTFFKIRTRNNEP